MAEIKKLLIVACVFAGQAVSVLLRADQSANERTSLSISQHDEFKIEKHFNSHVQSRYQLVCI